MTIKWNKMFLETSFHDPYMEERFLKDLISSVFILIIFRTLFINTSHKSIYQKFFQQIIQCNSTTCICLPILQTNHFSTIKFNRVRKCNLTSHTRQDNNAF